MWSTLTTTFIYFLHFPIDDYSLTTLEFSLLVGFEKFQLDKLLRTHFLEKCISMIVSN